MSEPRHHKEALNFTGFSGYYGLMSAHDGYGGFDYSDDVLYMNTSLFAFEGWCDSGYQNVAAATRASALGWIYLSGAFESANLNETFSLKSMIAASAWSSNQEWTVATYTYANGTLSLKGSENLYIGQYVEKIRFGQMGKNIAAFSITMDNIGSGGNTCTSGQPTYGYQLALGDLKVAWNGKIPHHREGHQLLLPGEMMHARHHATPNPIHSSGGAHAQREGGSHTNVHHGDSGYHSQLLALNHDPGALTNEFTLPRVEHLGT